MDNSSVMAAHLASQSAMKRDLSESSPDDQHLQKVDPSKEEQASMAAASPPTENVVPADKVPHTTLDELTEVVMKGRPSSVVSKATSASIPQVPLPTQPKRLNSDNFRAAGKTVIAANVISRPIGQGPPQKHTITAAQAMTRLTGVIFDNDGEIPAPLRSLAVTGITTMDNMKAQLDAYKPLVEQIVYWENMKVAFYFTTGIILTWLFTRIGMGFGWVIVILIMVGGAFRRNQQRLRRKLRNDLNKQMSMKRLETDTETVNWMNLFLTRFWLIFEPSLSAGIKDAVDAVLEANKPGFLDDLRLTTFTLGSEAPRVEGIRCYPSTSDDILMMDWDLSFSPIDDDEISKKQREHRDVRNSKIELTARVGKGVASIPLPVLVTEMEFKGKARIQLKFMTSYPHIKTVDFGFLEMPHIDFIVRPLKGMDLMDTPGLSSFLTDTINYYTKMFVVDPNKITIDLEQLLGGTSEADKPVGVLRVSLYEAKGLKNMELAGKSDPYALLFVGGKQVARTKTIDNTLDPVWDETFHIVITKSDLTQTSSNSDELKIEVMDWNNLQKDKSMGVTASLRLARWVKLLEDDRGQEADGLSREERDRLLHEWGSPFGDDTVGDIWKKLSIGDSQKGDVRFNMAYFPVQEPLAGTPAPDIYSGILQITVHQAKELPCSKNANTDCSIEQDGMELFRTPVKKKSNNPVWDAPFTVFVNELDMAKFKFRVWQGGQALGGCDILPREFIGKESTDDWFKLYGGKEASGRLRVTFKFTPVDLEGGNLDRSKIKRRNPAGLLRLHVVEAKGLMNVEMMGKSDPYTKLNLAGRAFGATHVKNNTLDPKWDEIFYAVCYSKKEQLALSLWDWNDFKKDRTLGRVEFLVGDLVKEDDEDVGSGEESMVDEAVGMRPEVLARLERDGLKIVRTGLTADVWAPVYIYKNKAEDLFAETAEATPLGSNEQLDHHRSSVNGIPNVLSLDGIASLATSAASSARPSVITGTKEPRQKGFIHFVLDYFPVVCDKIIHPERIVDHKRSRESIGTQYGSLPSVAEEEEEDDEEIKRQKEALQIEKRQAVEEAQEEQERVMKSKRERIEGILRDFHSGIVMIRVHEVQELCRTGNIYAEIVMDDDGPIWSTRTKKQTGSAKWDESLDKYISHVSTHTYTIQIRHQPEKDRSISDPIIGHWRGDITTLMGRSNYWVPLLDGEADQDGVVVGVVGKVRVSVGFAPVAVEGDSSETGGGMGMVHCDVLEARGLEAVDSGGASDPYVQIYLNGSKIHKTRVIKKTLDPVWNETFSCPVTSRLRSTLEFRVKDWNNFAKDVTLGTVRVQLGRLVPNTVVTHEYPLEGAAGGTIKLRMFFDPQAIESRRNSTVNVSSKSDVHDASARLEGEESGMTKMGKAVISRLAGTTVGLGKSMIDSGSDKKKTRGKGVEAIASERGILTVDDDAANVAVPPSSPVTLPKGTTTLHILEARNLKPVDTNGTSDPFIKVVQTHHGRLKTLYKTHVIKKSLNPVWNEKCVVVGPPWRVRVLVRDHNTVARNVELGEVDVDFEEWFSNQGEQEEDMMRVEKWVPLSLGGTGEVRLLAEYHRDLNGTNGSVGSGRNSVVSVGGGESPGSVRKVFGGFLGKKSRDSF
ncbi:uncharacterized protein SPPG_01407 [Spizellomyces punctatus DAOM BR117]|uniref:C2 domain-containing protein n=1 Tax=Spizellomyces punctatus (strain DAOM BR117) TaxID=645134 RepID=A0A0L0HSS2_SPIPD|nr:uncharacterized protein SPPG_01407 [Spizellomyces punctatus DAOM BR117]KND03955.1 hypothetical protein SPPG_01407 [Spizellomyces punctatus DAOM BR117]|eukprot:XP_016611994.1 hypothetical protein SPPG_01407 [Spizellomyces punctatus DAOM BR117]